MTCQLKLISTYCAGPKSSAEIGPTCPEAEQESPASEELADKAAGPYSPGMHRYGSSGHLQTEQRSFDTLILFQHSLFCKIMQKVVYAEHTAEEAWHRYL